jgi:hypothetical protein
MRIFDPLLSKAPVNHVLDQQFLFNRMIHAETHSADDADGYRLFILSLLRTYIAFHDATSRRRTFREFITFEMKMPTDFPWKEERKKR